MDLGIEEAHATEGMRKRIKAAVVASAGKLGLEIPNIGSTRSRREYNRYELPLPSIMQSDEPDMLIIEIAVMTPASPAKVRQIQSFIGEYCAAQGFDDAVSEYGLDAFDVRANSLERTFCDKVFALCDYYLSGEIPSRQLRHIYDLKKLSGAVDMDDDLLNLMTVVREQRVGGFRCPSADASVSIPATLREIVSTAAYKADYERLTMPLLYEGISYGDAIGVLELIARSLEEDERLRRPRSVLSWRGRAGA